MNDPELEKVREWLARDPIRPSDAPTQAGWRAIERRIQRRRLVRWAGLLAAAAIAAIVIGRAVTTPRDNARYVYIHVSDELEGVLLENRARLRPETVRALERSLVVIDSALAQAEQALGADPANEYVIRSIDQLRNRRLATLRDAVALAQE